MFDTKQEEKDIYKYDESLKAFKKIIIMQNNKIHLLTMMAKVRSLTTRK